MNSKQENTNKYITVKMLKVKKQRRYLKSSKWKRTPHLQRNPNKINS